MFKSSILYLYGYSILKYVNWKIFDGKRKRSWGFAVFYLIKFTLSSSDLASDITNIGNMEIEDDDFTSPAISTEVVYGTSQDLFNVPVTEMPVVLDLRSISKYQASHIIGALSLPLFDDNNTLIPLSEGIDGNHIFYNQVQQLLTKALEERGYDSYYKMVIYFDHLSSSTSIELLQLIEKNFLQIVLEKGLPLTYSFGDGSGRDDDNTTSIEYKKPSILILSSQYQLFEQRYPFLIAFNTLESIPDDYIDQQCFYPSLINEEWGLFLGAFNIHAKNVQVLIDLNIDVIINVTIECKHEFQGITLSNGKVITYHRLAAIDTIRQVMDDHWENANEILKDCKANGKRVLVHCAKGASRSASCILYYLVKEEGYSVDQALSYLQKCRSVVNPNHGFMKQLKDFEATLNR